MRANLIALQLTAIMAFSFHISAQQNKLSEIQTARKIVGLEMKNGRIQIQDVQLAGELCGTSPGMICRAMEFNGVTFELANGERKILPSVIFVNERLSQNGGGFGFGGPAGAFELSLVFNEFLKVSDKDSLEIISMMESAGARFDMMKSSEIKFVNTRKEFILFSGNERGETAIAQMTISEFIEPTGTVQSKADVGPHNPDVQDVTLVDPKTGKSAKFIQMDTKFSYEVSLEGVRETTNLKLKQ